MRISDWSSDVCSSDLDHLEKAVTTTATGKTVDGSDPVSWAKAHKEFPKYQQLLAQPNGPYTPTEMQSLVRAHRLLDMQSRNAQIGRASCRESVCQDE